jgi:hypothetical protein
MKRVILFLLIGGLIISFWGCYATRVEEDTYTITKRDTTYQRFINNAPGNRDNGVVFPSSRTFKNERDMLQYDSIVTRRYPDFIRYGFFEGVGLFGSSSENKIGTGLFGIYPEPENLSSNFYGDENALFSGGIYRFGIIEKRLRWFRDAKNWSWGINAVEFIVPDALNDHTLFTIAPFYIKKRYYLREEIPYVSVSLGGGIGWIPLYFSNYINLFGSLDVGSLGGMNARLYIGVVGGMNSTHTPQIRNSNNPEGSEGIIFPYLGIGFSALDFHNIVPETEREWKEHEHSSWNIGGMKIGFLNSGAGATAFSKELDSANTLKGLSLSIANASVAIPILNNQFYVGTSLLNLLILGKNEWGLGILPIRVGYWQTVLLDGLSIEPFIEYNYYPSSFYNIGGRLNLALNKVEEGETGYVNLSLIFGYASGNNNLGFGTDITDEIGIPGDFSGVYIGLSLGLLDRIFLPDELRYNK